MTRFVNIRELVKIVRSKNAKPLELTFDIIFKDRQAFELTRKSGVFTTDLICKLYKITPDKVLTLYWFEPANALKITIKRPFPAGDYGETDVYGAQQHAPLLSIQVPV